MSAPSCIYYRLYDLKKSVQLIVTYPKVLTIHIKKRRCISTFFSEMTLLSLIFIISEAKSILTNFEPIQIY